VHNPSGGDVMTRLSGVLFIVFLACVLSVVTGCGGSGPAEIADETGESVIFEPSATSVAAANRLTSQLGDNLQLVSTVRGVAEIGYEEPSARREEDFIVTTFRMKNLAENAIAGLKIDEFWFDTDGNTVTGDSMRFREPVLSGQIVDIELRVPRNPAMNSSNFEFSHQNGEILATLLETLDDPEEEAAEEELEQP
jgi:hypothetical protein